MGTVTLLLPSPGRLAGPLPASLAAMLGRADRLPDSGPGERAQLLRHFDLSPRSWPVAALIREADEGDAQGFAWLRADPAWVRPDINGARLFGCGEALQLTQADVDELLPALRPLFDDAGFRIDAPVPSRWYLRLPRDVALPGFVEPGEALGADLFDALPQDNIDAPGAARRWRSLLSEAQVVLHNHPWNARRSAAGKPPINSLWFWGGGTLPDQVSTVHGSVLSDDGLLGALAAAAHVPSLPVSPAFLPLEGSVVLDLRGARAYAQLSTDWLLPSLRALRKGTLERALLDFADGSGYRVEARQRWRFWCKPVTGLNATMQLPGLRK